MASSIAASRFASLKVEDDSDDENNQSKGSTSAKSAGQQKKKSKSKKKTAKSSTDELKELAFGGGKCNRTGSSHSGKSHSHASKQSSQANNQFDQWKEHDKEIVDDMFEKELQQAILASKIEQEKRLMLLQTIDEASTPANKETAETSDSHKKHKNKKKVMSIAEFQASGGAEVQHEEAQGNQKTSHAGGDNFFEEVEGSTARVLRQDKMQDEYSKQFKVQAVMQSKHLDELKERDQMIVALKTQLLESQEELKQVKKRNKQLCFILGQGEMKEKADILEQVDSLTSMKDELTSQITSLTSELEKERSKVHSLQNELTKLKSGKGKL